MEGILDHPGIDAVSFVGSAPVAKIVYERSAKAGKRVQALGGAKNHMVVMPDAVIDKTVAGIIGSAFGAAGQRCMAGSVVVTVGEAHERLVPALREATEKIRVGDGLDEDTELGAVVSEVARERILDMIDGVEEGAELLVDGRDPREPRTAVTSERRSSTGPAPRWTSSARRSSGRCSRWCTWTASTRPSTPSLTAGSATGCRSSPSRERRCALQARRRRGHGGGEHRRGRPGGLLPVQRLEGQLHGTCTPGPDAVEFYTKKKTVTSRFYSSGESGSYFVETRAAMLGATLLAAAALLGGGSEPVDATTAQRCPSRAPKGIRMPRWQRPRRATLLVDSVLLGAVPAVRARRPCWRIGVRGRPALMIDDAARQLRAQGRPVAPLVVVGLGYNSLWERDRRRYSMWAARFDREASVLVRTLRGLGARQIVWVTLRELRPGLVTPGGRDQFARYAWYFPYVNNRLRRLDRRRRDVVLAKWHKAADRPGITVRRDPHEHDRLAHHGANDLAAREQRGPPPGPPKKSAEQVPLGGPAQRRRAGPSSALT